MSISIKLALPLAAALGFALPASAQYGLPLDGVPGGFFNNPGLQPVQPNFPQNQDPNGFFPPEVQQQPQAVQAFVPSGPSLLSLVQNAAVQKDLKITEAQQGKLSEILKQSEGRTGGPAARQGRGAGRPPANFQEEGERVRANDPEAEAALGKVLDPKQRGRLIQIRLQAEGPMLFARQDLIQRLNLDPGQVEMIQGVVGSSRNAASVADGAPDPVPADGAPSNGERRRGRSQSKDAKARPEAAQATGANFQAEGTRKIYQVLRPRQREALRKILGEPFDLKMLQPGASQTAADVKSTTPATKPDAAKPAATSEKAVPAREATTPARKSLRERRGQRTPSNP